MVRVTGTDMAAIGCALVLLAGAVGCGGEENSQVSVDLFGWIDDGDGQFTDGMPPFDGADELTIRVTRPDASEVVDEQTVDFDQRRARLPDVPGGEDLRMEFEVSGGGEPIALGATPMFDVHSAEGGYYGFRAMVAPVDQFVPVASRQRDRDTGEERYMKSTFDVREYGDQFEWAGRIGHTAHPTESGEILIVGGGRATPAHTPGTAPSLSETLPDIQMYDPSTGYFTELAGDDDARDAGVVGEDRLEYSRAFHTVTPLGEDRFAVIGGFHDEGGNTVALDSVELIDLNAEPGQRVQLLGEIGGLDEPRGLHTATYRDSDGAIVVAGGLGADDEVRDTIELLDIDGGSLHGGISMQSPRVEHAAVLLEDDETVWFIGGRSDGGDALDTTEVLAAGEETASGGPGLHEARYGAAAIPLGEQGADHVGIFGGFTSEGVTASYEVGHPLVGGEQTEHDDGWELDQPRGGARVVMLPQSEDLLVIGGYDADGDPRRSIERLALDLDQLPPFVIDTGGGQMLHQRAEPAVAPVGNGRILVVAGDDPDGHERHDAEYYNVYDPISP